MDAPGDAPRSATRARPTPICIAVSWLSPDLFRNVAPLTSAELSEGSLYAWLSRKCEVTLTQTSNDKILYHTDNFVFRSEYEISTDVTSFFSEQDPALDRVAKDFAQRLVAAVVENY